MTSLGLRGQILAVLCTALLVSFSLLAVAVVQLGRRARELNQQTAAATLARTLSAVYRRGDPAFEVLVTELIAEGPVAGLTLSSPDTTRRVWGEATADPAASAEAAEGYTLALWMKPGRERRGSLTNLSLLYLGISAGVILLLVYIVLTLLIVRPVSALTRASERLAAGSLQVQVPVSGAGEIARLAQSFNGMATQLRRDRHALEERLQQVQETTTALRSTQDQLIRSAQLASVGRLSAGLAHEIGNPLSAILGLVELLQGPHLEAERRPEFLARIHRETGRIHHVLQDLLTFARREGSSDDLEGVTVLEQVVAEAVGLLGPQKDLQGIKLEVHAEGETFPVPGAKGPWTQVVVNLLLNAADAIGGEGRIDLHLWREDNSVLFQVRDTGSGIDDALLPTIFDPFVTSKEPGKGTGLGLSVCHTLVERAGGTLSAKNLDEGAVFEVRVPAADRPPTTC